MWAMKLLFSHDRDSCQMGTYMASHCLCGLITVWLACFSRAVLSVLPLHVLLNDSHTEGAGNMEEIATMIRVIAQGSGVDILVDPAQRTMRFNGTPDQIKLAQWMFPLLDAPNTASTAKNEYVLQGGNDNIVHLYYVKTPASTQQFQELATAIRTVADIRRVFTCNAAKALAARGTPDQIALADWLVGELDQSGHTAAVHQYRMTSGFERGESDVRVFYLSHAATMKDFQQVAIAIRNTANGEFSPTTSRARSSFGATRGRSRSLAGSWTN